MNDIAHNRFSFDLLLIVGGWFSVCGASYDYGDRDFLDFSTRAGKQFVWIICSFGLGFVLLMLVDRYFASSKICSVCGHKKKELALSDRMYVCECGNRMDRDVNAAVNIREEGKRIYKECA